MGADKLCPRAAQSPEGTEIEGFQSCEIHRSLARFVRKNVSDEIRLTAAAGSSNNLALKADGRVIAWGTPASVLPPFTNVIAIATGVSHSLALVGDSPPALHAPMSNPARSSTDFSVSVPAQSGKVYGLEYKDSLSDSNWTALPLAAGTGSMLTLTDPEATCPQRFYRVRQW